MQSDNEYGFLHTWFELKHCLAIVVLIYCMYYLFACFLNIYFAFRLVTDEERSWTDTNIDKVAMKHFPNIDFQKSLSRPILYSNWLSKDYVPVDREDLRDYVKARLKV